MTGSGKTTMARVLLDPHPFVAVFDAKGLLDWEGYTRVTTLRAATALPIQKHPRIIYAPESPENVDPAMHEAFFRWVYERKNTVCYVDEVYSVVRGQVAPPALLAILTRGRERNTPLYASTQRPMWVPNAFFTESENLYAFRLQLDNDRKKVADTYGIPEEQLVGLGKFEFVYARVGQETIAGPLRLSESLVR